MSKYPTGPPRFGSGIGHGPGPFPSYTSGHATISTAAATVLGHLFPADEDALLDRADEANRSRLWAGIHFPIDTEMGALGGGLIGRLVVARARDDGAE